MYNNNERGKKGRVVTIMEGLTGRQLRFAERYLSNGLDHYEAAAFANYSHPGLDGSRLLKKPHIIKYIESRRDKVTNLLHMDFDFKLKKLKNVIETAIPETIAKVGRDTTIGLQAIAEANKMQGHYAAEKHVNINANLELSPEEVEAQKIIDRIKEERKRDY